MNKLRIPALLGSLAVLLPALLTGCEEPPAAPPEQPNGEAIPFGERIELLVDEYLIGSTDGISFRLTEPEEVGQVIAFDEAWEGKGSLALTVLEDRDNIKLYYRGYPTGAINDASEKQTLCLAVSEDGVNFTKYPVNKISYNGITENNIVRMDAFCHNFAPFLDTNPDADPKEKYKAIAGTLDQGGVHVFASADGLHWNALSDGPVIDKGAFDSMNMAFYNPATDSYYAYSRYFFTKMKLGSELRRLCPNGARAIQSSVSQDFLTWTDPVENAYENGVTDQLYTNAVRPVPGAEHILVSFPMRFMEIRSVQNGTGISDCVFMSSRDGVYWDRTVSDAWLSGGLYSHEWSPRNFITAGGIVEEGDYFYLYSTKNYYWDDGGIWAYRVPRYRFMSLYADGDGGTFTTKLLSFDSNDIHLNFATSAYGSVQVTVLDAEGKEVFASDELFGNEISYRLNVPGLKGTEGKLVITLKEAHLYAIGDKMNAN